MIYLKLALVIYLISTIACIFIGRWIEDMDTLLDIKHDNDTEHNPWTPYKPIINTILVFLWIYCFAVSGFNMIKMREDWNKEINKN